MAFKITEDVPEEVKALLQPLQDEMTKLVQTEHGISVVTIFIVEHAGESNLGMFTNMDPMKVLWTLEAAHDRTKPLVLKYSIQRLLKSLMEDDDKPKEPNG